MEIVGVFTSISGAIGLSTIISFFIQRHFSKKDEQTREKIKKQNEEIAKEVRNRREKEEAREAQLESMMEKINNGLDTLRLLSYHRMSEEIERLLTQGYATPAERKVLKEMYDNYKSHKWNGDMDERLGKVYALPTIDKKKL